MPRLQPLLLVLFVVISCQNDNPTEATVADPISVKSTAFYSVAVEENVTYGQGLSHQTLNSASYTVMDLTFDIYTPQNHSSRKPAILLIHGGGFQGGDKTDPAIVNLATHFASRGWVAFSINYRLQGHRGTVPTDWINYAETRVPLEDRTQFLAMYPAHRDAKAALRWIVAHADDYDIDTEYITVGGGSAGAVIAVTLGVTNPTDFSNEISSSNDPTLSTTNLSSSSYTVKTILDFWGSGVAVISSNEIYGYERFDGSDAPMMIVHGTNDPTVLYAKALELRDRYTTTGVPFELHTLVDRGHGPWDAVVNGKSLEELAFDFVVKHQAMRVE